MINLFEIIEDKFREFGSDQELMGLNVSGQRKNCRYDPKRGYCNSLDRQECNGEGSRCSYYGGKR